MNDTIPYDVPALLKEARDLFHSFDLEDITEDRYADVIVDTFVTEHSASPSRAFRNLGGDMDAELERWAKDNPDDAGPDPDEWEDKWNEWEGALETVEDFGNELADAINAEVKEIAPDEPGRFSIGWRDGGFYLFYGMDVEDAE